MDLQKFYIDPKLITNDLFGKRGAEHELAEVNTEINICYTKMAFVVSIFFVPTLIVSTLVAIGGLINDWNMSGIFTGLIMSGVLTGLATLIVAADYFNDKRTIYATSKAKLVELSVRRKELTRMINVEADHFENSQAREIAPLLLARIRKHNSLIQDGGRIIELQKTLDRNSESKMAPQLEMSIAKKVETEHRDLINRLETYEVMKQMRADISLDITAALMDMKDFNKSDLNEFLKEKHEAMKLLLDDSQDEGILPA